MGWKLRTRVFCDPEELELRTADYDHIRKKEREYCADMKFDYDCRQRVVEGDELSPGNRIWISDLKTKGTVIKQHESPRSTYSPRMAPWGETEEWREGPRGQSSRLTTACGSRDLWASANKCYGTRSPFSIWSKPRHRLFPRTRLQSMSLHSQKHGWPIWGLEEPLESLKDISKNARM